jgi:hypothetical protein
MKAPAPSLSLGGWQSVSRTGTRGRPGRYVVVVESKGERTRKGSSLPAGREDSFPSGERGVGARERGLGRGERGLGRGSPQRGRLGLWLWGRLVVQSSTETGGTDIGVMRWARPVSESLFAAACVRVAGRGLCPSRWARPVSESLGAACVRVPVRRGLCPSRWARPVSESLGAACVRVAGRGVRPSRC